MNAVAYKSWFDLELPQSTAFPRSLNLKWSAGFGLSAWIFVGEGNSCFCAYHSEPIEKCRIEKARGEYHLRIGTGSINISTLEAARILGTYGSLRLTTSFPCAVNLGPDTAKQAALTADPLGSERGISPAPAFQAEPASLESR